MKTVWQDITVLDTFGYKDHGNYTLSPDKVQKMLFNFVPQTLWGLEGKPSGKGEVSVAQIHFLSCFPEHLEACVQSQREGASSLVPQGLEEMVLRPRECANVESNFAPLSEVGARPAEKGRFSGGGWQCSWHWESQHNNAGGYTTD